MCSDARITASSGPIFVVGMNGSGTTMLLNHLDSHSTIYGFPQETRLLPQMLAAGLSNITTESPGWGEIRKLAGRPYAQLTNLIENIDSPEALSLAARLSDNNSHV